MPITTTFGASDRFVEIAELFQAFSRIGTIASGVTLARAPGTAT